MPLITGEHHLHLKTGLDVFVIFNDKWQQVVLNKATHLSRVVLLDIFIVHAGV